MASAWTEHVGLIIGREMLGTPMQLHSALGGRLLRATFAWEGEPVTVYGLYAPGNSAMQARQRFFRNVHLGQGSMVVLGDFNCVREPERDIATTGN